MSEPRGSNGASYRPGIRFEADLAAKSRHKRRSEGQRPAVHSGRLGFGRYSPAGLLAVPKASPGCSTAARDRAARRGGEDQALQDGDLLPVVDEAQLPVRRRLAQPPGNGNDRHASEGEGELDRPRPSRQSVDQLRGGTPQSPATDSSLRLKDSRSRAAARRACGATMLSNIR